MVSMSMMIMIIWWWWSCSSDDDDHGDDACLLGKRSRRSSSVGVLHRICSSFFLSFFGILKFSVWPFPSFVLLLLLVEINFVWKPISCFRLLLFSCEFDENFGVLPFFLSFSGFGFCRSLLPWEFQSRDVVVVTFWRFEELGVVAVDYFSFCSWFVCLFVLPSIFS